MIGTVLPSAVLAQLKSEDSAQKIEGICSARIIIVLWNTQEVREQNKSLTREERLIAATLPRRLFELLTSDVHQVAREVAFALVASSKSYQEYYLHRQKFADLLESEYGLFVEHLEAFLSTHRVDLLTNSSLVYTGENETHYFATGIFKIFYRMKFEIGGRPVQLKGLPEWEENCFDMLVQYPQVEVTDCSMVETSLEEKEEGVVHKGVAKLSIVKVLYDASEAGIRFGAHFNGVLVRRWTKIEGMPEKVLI